MTGLLAVASLAAMILWLYLLLARARLAGPSYFDQIDTTLLPDTWPAVSVIVPARNEADMLRFTLPSVLSFYYPHVEIILIDDCSTDGTPEVAQRIAAGQEGKLQIVRGTTPPEGWRGKLWALAQGVEAGRGEWLLFTDADIYYKPNTLRDLVRTALTQRYDLVSLMALLRTDGFWDRLLIPPFFFFFHLLYPFHQVRDPQSRTAAAAGGCMLVNRSALAEAGGLSAIRGAWIDDVALAALFKRSSRRTYLGATVQAASFRRYGALQAIWQMVSRSAFTELRHSWALVLVTVAANLLAFVVPPAGLIWSALRVVALDPRMIVSAVGGTSICALGFMIAGYAPSLRLYRLPLLWAWTLPGAALLYTAMTVESALSATFGDGPKWKGRPA